MSMRCSLNDIFFNFCAKRYSVESGFDPYMPIISPISIAPLRTFLKKKKKESKK